LDVGVVEAAAFKFVSDVGYATFVEILNIFHLPAIPQRPR
jgi:hypothetical protein